MTTTTPSFSPVRVRINEVDFVNLTPHAIVFRDADGADHTIPPSGEIARIGTSTTAMPGNGMFVRVDRNPPIGWGKFMDLPTDRPLVGIVSGMFLDGVVQRLLHANGEDGWAEVWDNLLRCIVAPNTDDTAIRDAKGHIVAVRTFRTEVLPWDWRKIGLKDPSIR